MKRIELEMAIKKVNRKQMAEDLGLKYNDVCYMVRGYQPKDNKAQKVADYLGWKGELETLFDTIKEI